MARLMGDVFRATLGAAASAYNTQRLDGTGKLPLSGGDNNAERLLRDLLSQVQQGTLPMGTMGNAT